MRICTECALEYPDTSKHTRCLVEACQGTIEPPPKFHCLVCLDSGRVESMGETIKCPRGCGRPA